MSGPSGDGPSSPLPPPRPPEDSPLSADFSRAGPSRPSAFADAPPFPARRTFLLDLGFLLFASAALVVPSWLASPPAHRPLLTGAVEAPRRIHLNRSPWYEWTLLPGIGEARARRIVDFRALRGGFRSVEDLDQVPGMPRDFAARARPFLTLEDPPGGGGAMLR